MKSFNIAKLLNVPGLPSYIEQIEKELNHVLLSDNPVIRQPILRLIKSKSKRLRPSLLVAIVLNNGLKVDEKVIKSCVALELVHIASLVHDDIIDNAETRWDVPTINFKEGTNLAIMIGDYLFAKANQQAALASLDVAKVISHTIEKLCEGEILEMTDEFNKKRSIGALIEAIDGKTAALISATCKIGGLCANLSEPEINALNKFGKIFGMSFQFIDDILDFISTSEIFGKPVGNDVSEGVYNLPIILSLSKYGEESLDEWLGSKKVKDNSGLIDLLIKNESIEKSIKIVKEYNKLAVDELEYFLTPNSKESLEKLPSAYFDYAFSNLVAPKYKKYIQSII